MTLIKKRELTKKYLNDADERFIDMVYAMIEADTNSIVGYNSHGKAITRKDLRKRVMSAEQRIKKGQFITQGEIEEESKGW